VTKSSVSANLRSLRHSECARFTSKRSPRLEQACSKTLSLLDCTGHDLSFRAKAMTSEGGVLGC
jgi:hypothetical protein